MMLPVHIPGLDIVSHVLGGSDTDLGAGETPIYIDIADPRNSLSRADVRVSIRELIAGLQRIGLRPGDVVCLCSSGSIHYTSILLAVIGAGGCFLGVNPRYTDLELAHVFSVTKPRYLLLDRDTINTVVPVGLKHRVPRENIIILDHQADPLARSSGDGFTSLATLRMHGQQDWIRFSDVDRAKATPAALLMTSGTTGMPKAAVMSHYAHVSQDTLSDDSKFKTYKISRLLCLPLFHSFVTSLAHMSPLRCNIPTYIMTRFDLEACSTAIERHQITDMAVVPPMVRAFLSLPPTVASHRLASLRNIYCAGSPMDRDVQTRFVRLLHPEATVSQVWGTTETWWITTFQWPERDDTGSVGRLLPGVEAQILDPENNPITTDHHPGELLIRTPSHLTSYLSNPLATSTTLLPSGWLPTGDLGYRLGPKFYIVDRIKDMLKVRGWQVSPAEIEAVLLTHAAVADVAVVGVDGAEGRGEVPRGYVVVEAGFGGDREVLSGELCALVRGRLSGYKRLEGGVRFVEGVPRNASGKVVRRLLREGGGGAAEGGGESGGGRG